MNFQRGIPPVESDMGVVCHNTRRAGGSLIFDMWQLSVQVNVQNAARSIRLPDSGSGLIPGDFPWLRFLKV
jgi:hypothetical protein